MIIFSAAARHLTDHGRKIIDEKKEEKAQQKRKKFEWINKRIKNKGREKQKEIEKMVKREIKEKEKSPPAAKCDNHWKTPQTTTQPINKLVSI